METRQKDQIEIFIEAIAGQSDNAQLETRQFKSGEKPLRHFHSTNREFTQSVWGWNQHAQGWDQFFGVGLRHGGDGSKNGVRTINALWADLDNKDFENGKSDAWEQLTNIPVMPAFIVDSGNGLHAYWPLKEPFPLDRDEDRTYFESYLKRLAHTLGADSSVAETARVMRIPGTYNWKNPKNPLPVKFVTFEPNRQCNLGDFDSILIESQVPEVRRQTGPGWVAQTLSNLKNGNRNTSLTRVAGKLRRDGWVSEDILSLLVPHAVYCGFSERELRDIVRGICARYKPNDSVSVSSIYSEKTETESRPYEAISISELVSRDIPEIPWITEPLVPAGSVAILSAPGGHGKSWALLDLAIECSRGGKWFGHFLCSSGNVLYIDEESISILLQRRVSKILRAKGLSDADLPIMFTVLEGVKINDDSAAERLGNLIQANRPNLVIIDSLIRVNNADENSSVEMSKFFYRIKQLAKEYGCSIIFADHHRKPGIHKSSPDLMLRGSSEKVAFVDSLLCLSKTDERIVVTHAKSRFCEELGPFIVELKETGNGGTEILYAGEAGKIFEEERLQKSIEFISENLSTEWTPRKSLIELGKNNGLAAKSIDGALTSLTKAGLIERESIKIQTGRAGKSACFRMINDAGGET